MRMLLHRFSIVLSGLSSLNERTQVSLVSLHTTILKPNKLPVYTMNIYVNSPDGLHITINSSEGPQKYTFQAIPVPDKSSDGDLPEISREVCTPSSPMFPITHLIHLKGCSLVLPFD